MAGRPVRLSSQPLGGEGGKQACRFSAKRINLSRFWERFRVARASYPQGKLAGQANCVRNASSITTPSPVIASLVCRSMIKPSTEKRGDWCKSRASQPSERGGGRGTVRALPPKDAALARPLLAHGSCQFADPP
jgi:hypothetical protein